MRAARVVLAAGLVAIAVAVVVVASQRAPRLLGSDRVLAVALPLELHRARTACEDVVIPAGTGDVRLLVGTAGAPRPPLSLSLNGQVAGRVGVGSPRRSWVRIPLTRTPRVDTTTRACLTAAGHAPVALGGDVRPKDSSAKTPDGRPLGAVFRLEFETRGAESWWSTLGPAARRFDRGKAGWVGTWTLVLVAVLAAGALAATGWALIREPRA